MVIKEPIKIICIKTGNSKLVKGAIYSAISNYIYTSRNGTVSHTVRIKGVGTYDANNFTLLDGSSIQNMMIETESPKMLNPDSVNYTGQFIKCRCGSSKSLKEGEIYYVEHQIKVNEYGYNSFKLKIRGVRNMVTPYNFYEISIAEQRLFKLKNLKGEKIKTGEQTRKFLLYSEKEKTSILFDVLSKVLIDIVKIDNFKETGISIPNLMIKKGSKYAIIEEDIKSFLTNNFSELLKSF